MSKKKNRSVKENVEKEVDYYSLKTDAVRDLVEANESNSPKVSEEELKKYTSGHKFNIPEWVKMLFIKFWFAGAVCFFFIWGLSIYMADMLDTLVVTGLALGFVTDILTNNALRFMEKTKGGNDKYIMVTKRGYASLFLNILYAGVVLFFVYTAYNVINMLITLAAVGAEVNPLGVEPLLFGLLYMCFDQLFITMKHIFIKIISDAKEKAQ